MHINNSTNLKKNSPFFSPKCPRGTRTRILPRSVTVVLYLVKLPPHFDRVSEKTMDGTNVMRQKVSFLAIVGHFGAFLAIKEPLGRNEIYFRKSENVSFSPI